MQTIAYEDKANPGTLYIPKSHTLNHKPRHERLSWILKDLRHTAQINIYLVTIRGTRVVKERKIASRGW